MANEDGKISIKNLLNGKFITRDLFFNQFKFILLWALLGLFYISNHFHAEKILRETQKLEKELHEMRAESITRTSNLMFMSKQSQVSKLVKDRGLGLEEAITPPRQIIVDR